MAKREKAKREGTCRTDMGVNGGHTKEELEKAKQLFPREFQQAVRHADKKRNEVLCHHCKGGGHIARRSKACGEHHMLCLEKLKKWKQGVGATDDAVEDDAVEDDVCTGEDAPAAQTARDESECDVLDSIYLDGSDEFFDCIEHGDLN